MKYLLLFSLLSTQLLFAQPQPVTPEDYGADNDSTTMDDIIIQKTLDAAGEYATIVFKPTVTYLLKAAIRPLKGQTLIGYGAKLKSADQFVTTTRCDIAMNSSPTTITVDDVSGLEIGMQVTVTNGPNMIDGCYAPHTILSISGNQITVSVAFTKAFSSGSKLVTHHGMIDGTNGAWQDEVKVLGFEIDGNRLHNLAYAAWQTNYLIYLSGAGVVVRDCYLHDGQSDGIMMGGIGSIADNNRIERMGGNGIHLSGLTNGKVVNNYIYYCTLSITGVDNGSGPSHAEGAMTWSNLVSNTLVDGNHMGYARAMLGVIDGTDNNDNIITHNFFEHAYLYGIEFKYGGGIDDNSLKNLILSENKWKNCARLYFNNNGSNNYVYGSANRNFIVSGNLFDNTTIEVARGKDFQLLNNIFDQHGDSTLVSIDLYSCSNYISSYNIINYGQIGIRINPSRPYVGNHHYVGGEGSIDNNHFRDQSLSALFIYGEDEYEYEDLDVFRNSILQTTNYRNNYVGIYAANGVTLEKNRLLMSSGKYGIQCMGDAIYYNYGNRGTTAINNYVSTPVGTPSFRVFGGAGNNIIKNNSITQPMSISQPADNTVLDNMIIK